MSARALIFPMSIPRDKTFPWVPFFTLWPRPKSLTHFLPASPKAWSAVTPSVCPFVRPKILSSQLLWNYWSNYHETWYVDRISYVVVHIGRKFRSPHFCGSYAPWNLENIRKSTNNLSFLCQFFINEKTASDTGPDIIRSHLLYIFFCKLICSYNLCFVQVCL